MKRTICIFLLTAAAACMAGPAEGLINQLKGPRETGDAQARIDLRWMTHEVMEPGANASSRLTHQQDLLSGLDSKDNRDIKAHLIRELGLCGMATAIPPLAAYLSSSELHKEAASAIEMICRTSDCTEGVKAIKSAIFTEKDANKIETLIRLAGHIGVSDTAVVDIIEQNAAAQDWNLKSAALQALAEIGNPGSAGALSRGLGTDDAYQKARIITWNLEYALRLAQQDLKTEASSIAEAIKTLGQGEENLGGSQGNAHVIRAADLTLEAIKVMVVRVKGPETGTMYSPVSLRLSKGDGNSAFNISVISAGAYKLTVTNILGRRLWSRNGRETQVFSLPGSLLRPGYYSLTLESGHEKLVKSLIVE